jgi:hypothetical protein
MFARLAPIAALLAGILLSAQMPGPAGFPPGVFLNRGALDAAASAGCTVTCPGDLGFGAVTAWVGFRCWQYAYSGNVADIWDSATGSATETLITCSNGNLVATSPTAIATTCAVACSVKTLYDQTAGNNCTSATCNVTEQGAVANWPIFKYQSASCGTNSGLSCMQCPTTPTVTPLQSATALTSTAQTFYMSIVFYDSTSSIQDYATNGASQAIQHGNPANTARITDNATNSATVTATDSVWHALQGTFAGASSVIDLDGTVTTGLTVGTSAASGKFTLCSSTSAGSPMVGYIAEYGMWPSTSTFSNSTMTTNQQSFYGGL